MDTLELMKDFTPLEVVLMSGFVALLGAIGTMARFFYTYMKSTNKERAEEIRSATKIQTELIQTMQSYNKTVEQLPERISDKIQIALRKQ